MPHAVQVSVAFAHPDVAETGFAVERETGVVFGHHLGLQCPVPFGLRDGDQSVEERGTNPPAMGFFGNIDADLSDTRGASGVRYRRQGGPADNFPTIRPRHQTPDIEMPVIPVGPAGRGCHKSGKTGRESFAIQVTNLFPVFPPHIFEDGERHV